MKRVLMMSGLLLALIGIGVFAQTADAGGHGYGHGHNYSVFRVRAFTFQPSYSLQSFAYATYPTFAVYALPPVVTYVAPPPVQYTAPPPVPYTAPAAPVTYTAPEAWPQTYQLLSAAPTYGAAFSAGPGYSTFRVSAGRDYDFRGFRSGHHDVSFRSRQFRADFSGAVIQERRTVERSGLFGLRRSVTETRTIAPANSTFFRNRLR